MPIQKRAIPLILEGRDVVGAAQTGTGKTAAFVLPILARLLEGPRRLRALVLSPTRELAAQVETNARDYARFTDLRVGVVFGGVPDRPAGAHAPQQGVELLVATPGRLLDLHGRQSVALDEVEILVLDEADRMVDMGFAPDLGRILRLLPEKRQTLMFSATMPPDLNKVASQALVDPVRIDLAPPSRPAAGITQAVYPVPRHLKTDLLDDPAVQGRGRQRDRVRAHQARRRPAGAPAPAARAHRWRRCTATAPRASASARSPTCGAAACRCWWRPTSRRAASTSRASRTSSTSTCRAAPEDYVHRIGRTGRVDAVGDAFTLMGPEEQKDLVAIERFLGKSHPARAAARLRLQAPRRAPARPRA